MPKYYIRDGYEMAVVDAKTATHACVKATLYYFTSFTINGTFIASEKGFKSHDDDTILSSNHIIDVISDIKRNMRNSEDGD